MKEKCLELSVEDFVYYCVFVTGAIIVQGNAGKNVPILFFRRDKMSYPLDDLTSPTEYVCIL